MLYTIAIIKKYILRSIKFTCAREYASYLDGHTASYNLQCDIYVKTIVDSTFDSIENIEL